jgi:chloramphenicol 3-O-phosphotransferase
MLIPNQTMSPGMIILLNGASSSGKTSILKDLQDILEEPYVDAGLDKFLIEMDTSINNPEECARQVIARIRSGDPPTAFSRLKALQEVRHKY